MPSALVRHAVANRAEVEYLKPLQTSYLSIFIQTPITTITSHKPNQPIQSNPIQPYPNPIPTSPDLLICINTTADIITYSLHKGIKDQKSKKANNDHLTMPEKQHPQAVQYTNAFKRPVSENPAAREELRRGYQQRLLVGPCLGLDDCLL